MKGDPETIARFLSTKATNLLLKFDGQPWGYDTMPMPGRLELFQAGLLIGCKAARNQHGAKLTQLGADVQRLIKLKAQQA